MADAEDRDLLSRIDAAIAEADEDKARAARRARGLRRFRRQAARAPRLERLVREELAGPGGEGRGR